MRLFKKKKEMNNKGFSLVEILCAVAILGIATTAIGSAMIVSAQNYNRNNVEMEVQQEAQTATNLIGELLVDAVDAKRDGDVLKITGDGVIYEVNLDTSTAELKYKEIRGTDVVTGVLAENVTKFEPKVPADFKKDKSVNIDLAITEAGKVYTATYNATARNGEVSSIPGVTETVVIDVPSEIIVEPNQTITIPVELDGMSFTEVNGLTWDYTAGEPDFIVDGSVSLGTLGNGLTFTLKDTAGKNGSDFFNITVRTGKNIDGVLPETPLAFTSVTVKVRRVEKVDLVTTLISGEHAKKDAEYRIDASVDGSYFASSTEYYDTDSYAYKNPRYVDLEASGTPKWTIVDVQEKCDNPYMIIKLADDLYDGEKITVTGVAMHPEGIYAGETCNKASAQPEPDEDKPYGNRIMNSTDIDGYGGGSIIGGGFEPPSTGGLRRGDKEYWVLTFSQAEQDYFQSKGADSHFRYWRFWEKGSAEPAEDEGWMQLDTSGDYAVQLQELQSMIFDIDKAYVVELKYNICKNSDRNQIVWPEDTTPRDKYILRFEILEADITFKSKGVAYWDSVNSCIAYSDAHPGYESYSKYIGTYNAPIEMKAGIEYEFDVFSQRLNYKTLQAQFNYRVQRYNVNTGTYEDCPNILEISSQGLEPPYEDHGTLKIKAQQKITVDGVQVDTAGQKFRILTTINYRKSSYDFSTKAYSQLSVEEAKLPANTFNAYNLDPSSADFGNGCFYIEFTN